MIQALRRVTALFAVLMLVGLCAMAQSDNAAISGIVRDP